VKPWLRAVRAALVLATVAFALFTSRAAFAQSGVRKASFVWNSKQTRLFVSMDFSDAIDRNIKGRLKRGLPTVIVLTGAMYLPGNPAAVSTTAQTCKVTYLVWDEVYQFEITRPDGTNIYSALTPDRLLKKCVKAESLPVATSGQISPGTPVYMNAKVQVNPVSKDVVDKIKKWVSRPSGTGTAAPGDALFSTFTGLFLQRIGDADRELKFTTNTEEPRVAKPAQTKPKPSATGKK
jgi:hypothetical protein